MDLIYKTLELTEFKAGTDDNTFEGYASTFSNPDRVGDIMEPGCFKECLPDFLRDGFLSDNHDWSSEIGYFTDAYETPKGLYVKGVYHDTPEAQAKRSIARGRLKAGKTVGLSVGFKTQSAVPVYEDRPYGPRKFTKVKLYEVAQATVPCNDQAGLTRAKGGRGSYASTDHAADLRALVEGMKAENPEGMKALADAFTKYYAEAMEKDTPPADPAVEPDPTISTDKAAPSTETRSERVSGRELATALVRAIETDYYVGSLLTTN